jgi:hypothetical protein
MSPCRTNHQTSSFGSPGASIRYAIGGCYRLPTNAFQLVAALHTTGENKAEDCVCIGRAPVLVSFALTSPIGISRTPHAAALLHANHTHLPYSVSAAPGQCRSSVLRDKTLLSVAYMRSRTRTPRRISEDLFQAPQLLRSKSRF